MKQLIDRDELIAKCHPIVDVPSCLGTVGLTLSDIQDCPVFLYYEKPDETERVPIEIIEPKGDEPPNAEYA